MPPGALRFVEPSKDLRQVAFVCDEDLSVWDLRTGQKKPVFQTEIRDVQGLALFSGRPWVVAASTDTAAVKVWDIVTGEKLLKLEGFSQVLETIVVSPDERRLVTSNIGIEPIRFWDTESWNEVLAFQGRPGHALSHPHFLPDGNTFAAEEVDRETGAKRLVQWRAPTLTEIRVAEGTNLPKTPDN